MKSKSLNDVAINGKKVIVRVDFNVPIKDGVVQDTKRIRAALDTINVLIEKGASKIILLSHLSRIKTEEDKAKKSLKPVAAKLQELSGHKVIFVSATRGADVEKAINAAMPGELVMLENTRFEDVVNNEVVKLESKNNAELGKYWAGLADVFVNDAFGTAHRAHASNVGIATNIKESCLGLLVENEMTMLTKAVENPAKPVVAIIGGAKVADKIGVINAFAKSADTIVIVGGMAYTFLKAMNQEIGKSMLDEENIELAKKYIADLGNKIVLPIDHVVAKEFADKPGTIVDTIPTDSLALDIGPKTVELIKNRIADAKTIIWNGPAGVFEMDNFAKGTEGICKAIASMNGVYSIIGGGDSAAAAIKLGYEDKFSHISTGGGASLELFEGKVLPGIAAIQTK